MKDLDNQTKTLYMHRYYNKVILFSGYEVLERDSLEKMLKIAKKC